MHWKCPTCFVYGHVYGFSFSNSKSFVYWSVIFIFKLFKRHSQQSFFEFDFLGFKYKFQFCILFATELKNEHSVFGCQQTIWSVFVFSLQHPPKPEYSSSALQQIQYIYSHYYITVLGNVVALANVICICVRNLICFSLALIITLPNYTIPEFSQLDKVFPNSFFTTQWFMMVLQGDRSCDRNG